ncbi:Ribosomal protein L25/L23 [Desulfarculus baarsii DSM 2075]|uniref:Large ribosomal subunit protein uL23 n=1 Tax=Desulfarculus baarsii (strain ATCC 33931 / DSM 2075 / LMG 7858 / VKM B-1802 / 2st14) TaxID=644282 RepID=E1QKT0_DESB2|nr:50S ribosomal protein L23 [Desulfarculus baarsii]ADK86289.1 Ribosomal protein L25/L23 [Desulfarculus baarsii DSM 2075]
MKDLREVIRRPLITEKGTIAKEDNNQLLFEVDRRANKVEIRQAVEKLFDVKVLDVRTVSVKGKDKRMGRIVGRRSDWKKAYVTLAEGQSVDFFEGA